MFVRPAIAVVAGASSLASAQPGHDPFRHVPVHVDSGIVTAHGRLKRDAVVFSRVVRVPDAAWVRLRFAAVTLPDHGPGARARLRLTSVADGDSTPFTAENIGQWGGCTPYFNGDAVLVEIVTPFAGEPCRIVIDEALANQPAAPTRTICGPTDDRVLSCDPRVGRYFPNSGGICTAWLITDARGCLLTAGHCGDYLDGTNRFDYTGVVEFNYPLSNAQTGIVVRSPLSDQYAIDPASIQASQAPAPAGGYGHQFGNDWAYLGCFPNSVTGLTSRQTQGAAFALAASAPALANPAQVVRATGNGTNVYPAPPPTNPIPPAWADVQKTHTGNYGGRNNTANGIQITHFVDTTGNNSGSPVFLESNQLAIGIHTNGGCDNANPPTTPNSGTAIDHVPLQNALGAPTGCCGVVTPDFIPLGDLAGDAFYSVAWGMSPEGHVVVGQSDSGASIIYEAFRWDGAGGMTGMGYLVAGSQNSSAMDAATDGSTIVGTNDLSGTIWQAFKWNAVGGMQALPPLPPPGFSNCSARACSADGSTIVGRSGSPSGEQACRWSNGVPSGLGDLAGGSFLSQANDCSANGSVIVGWSSSTGGTQAFRWTSAAGMVGLGELPGGIYHSVATAVSADGTTIVGYSDTTGGGPAREAWRWTAATGMVGLGGFPGGIAIRSAANAVSADGSVIVGYGRGSNPYDEAFIWDAVNGMRNLQTVLVTGFGLNLQGLRPERANAISGDGGTIAGGGVVIATGDGEAWVAHLTPPEPGCRPPLVLHQPVGGTYAHGETISLHAPAVRTAPLAYQWRRNGTNLVEGGRIAGSTACTLQISACVLGDTGDYDLVVTNACGAATSGIATVIVSCPADIDHNGVITPADIAVFVNTWFDSLNQGTLAGDFDGNGRVEPADVAVFITTWSAALAGGC